MQESSLRLSDKLGIIAMIVREARREAGLSQRALAKLLGKANSHVSMIENGRRRIDVLELYLIARFLHLEPIELFSRIADRLGTGAHSAQSRQADRLSVLPAATGP